MEQSLFPRVLRTASGEWGLLGQDGQDLKTLAHCWTPKIDIQNGVCPVDKFKMYCSVSGWISPLFTRFSGWEAGDPAGQPWETRRCTMNPESDSTLWILGTSDPTFAKDYLIPPEFGLLAWGLEEQGGCCQLRFPMLLWSLLTLLSGFLGDSCCMDFWGGLVGKWFILQVNRVLIMR